MRITKILTLALLSTLCPVSCLTSPSVKVGKDTKQIIATPELLNESELKATRPRAIFHKSYIEVQVTQEPGFNVGNIYPSVYNGDIYLNPLYISSGGDNRQSFRIDYPEPFTFENQPRQILWITSYGYSFPWSREAKSMTAYALMTSIAEQSIEAP